MILALLLSLLFLPSVFLIWWTLLRPLFWPSTLDNLPGPKPSSIWSGSMGDILSICGWNFYQDIADKYGGIIKFKGLFGADNLYIFDAKALHHILVKDQDIYEETDAFLNMNRMILGEGIFTTTGERHRLHRKILQPIFTASQMRSMLPIFYEITHKVKDKFEQTIEKGTSEIDMMEWTTRIALELIGQSGLGYSFDDLSEDTASHPFALASKKIPNLASQFLVARNILLPLSTWVGTPKFRKFLVDLLPFQTVKVAKGIVEAFYSTSVEIYAFRKTLLAQGDIAAAAQIGKGKDIISLLMKANADASDEDRLSEEEIIGQISSITFAATDTTSAALCRTFHLLAQNKHVQDKVRQELRVARQKNEDKDVNYDVLITLPYLDAVCRETLRLYPPVSWMERTVLADVVLPLANTIKGNNGQDITELHLKKGTDLIVSLIGCNRNTEYWGPDALQWKPERWLDPLPDSLVNARIPGIYSHLMTFLGGGRSCIGFKFSQLEMKSVLAVLVEMFEFSLTDKEIYWQMSTIATPVHKEAVALPITVSLAN